MKGSLVPSILFTLLLSGCGTLKGADDAILNLVGPSTQSRLDGRYLEQAEVREYYKLDAQKQSKLRLSYDGRAIPANDIRQQNIVEIPALQSYLQDIVTRLSKGWPGELPPLQVRIIDSYTYGPSADPYGNLFVPLGMLDNVESEDEIAALLGHEMSHVLLRHHDRREAFQQQKELLTMAATTLVVAAAASNTRVDRSSGKMKFISKAPLGTQKTIGNTVMYTALANTFSDNVWNTAWGRSQEDQADLLGTDLMIRAGYSPRAASHSLQRLSDFQGKQQPLLASFLTARKNAMQESLKKFNVNGLTKEFEILLNQGFTTSIASAGQYLTRSHMSPTDRDKELRQYLQREYRQERRTRVDRSSWPKVRDSATVAPAMQGYKDAYAATAALEQGKLSEAELFSKRALSSPVRDQPGIRRSSFSVRLAQGQSREALKEIESIKNWSLASPSIYELMINYHIKRGDPSSALAMIDKAEHNLGSEEQFITEKLVANQQLKNESQVQHVLRKCDKYPGRKDTCKKLAPQKA